MHFIFYLSVPFHHTLSLSFKSGLQPHCFHSFTFFQVRFTTPLFSLFHFLSSQVYNPTVFTLSLSFKSGLQPHCFHSFTFFQVRFTTPLFHTQPKAFALSSSKQLPCFRFAPIFSWFRICIHGFRFGFAVSYSEVEYETGKFKSDSLVF